MAIQCFMEEVRLIDIEHVQEYWKEHTSLAKEENRMGNGQNLDHPWGPYWETESHSELKKAEKIMLKGILRPNGGRP